MCGGGLSQQWEGRVHFSPLVAAGLSACASLPRVWGVCTLVRTMADGCRVSLSRRVSDARWVLCLLLCSNGQHLVWEPCLGSLVRLRRREECASEWGRSQFAKLQNVDDRGHLKIPSFAADDNDGT